MVVCRYLGRSCIEVIAENDHIVIDPNYVKAPKKGVNKILLTHEHDDHFSPEKIRNICEDFVTKEQESKIYGPISIKGRVKNISPSIVKDGSIIKLSNGHIDVFEIDCWKAEACVAYLLHVDDKRILHTADSAGYSDRLKKVENGIDCCFVATFEDYYRDYLRFIKTIRPKLTVPYHFGPNKRQMGKKTAQFLKENGVNVNYLNFGEEIIL